MQLTLVTAVALLYSDIPLNGSIPTLLGAGKLFLLVRLSVGLCI